MTFQAPSGSGLSLKRELDLAVEPAAEERVVVVAGLDRLAVDGDQVVPLLDLDPVLVGRPVFVDVRDLVAAAGRIGLEVQAEVPGHDAGAASPPWPRSRPAEAPVCEALSSPIISLMTFISSWRSATKATSGLYLARMASQSVPCSLGS